jgi:hypothetical protein
MSSVNERNATALAEAIKADRLRMDAMQERITQMEKQLAMQVSTTLQLQQTITVLQATRSRGPTSR